MALYLGSSEINPVETVEIIKEVPTEKDLTLMGNELRRAYCWSKTVDAQGMCQIYSPYTNIFSEAFEATTIKGLSIKSNNYISDNDSTYVIIDGKLYSVSVTSSAITLTQQGNDTDWNDVNNSIWIKGGKIYTSYSNASSGTNPIMNSINTILPKYGGYYTFFINDGNLYYGSTLVDGSGVWTDIKNFTSNVYGVGLRNNKLYFYFSNSYKDFGLDYTITNPDLYGFSPSNVYFCLGNKLYLSYINYNGGYVISTKLYYEYPSNIKKISTGYNRPEKVVLLENGDVYYDKTKKLSNIKTYITYTNEYFLSNDDKIYKYDGTLIRENFPSDTFKEKGPNYSCFQYTNSGSTITYNQYTTQYVDEITKSYPTYISSGNSSPVTSSSSSSITVNGNEYTRNGSGDAVFTFIPEDLENHTFSDTDLLQAYLDAGIRQQQNNNT